MTSHECFTLHKKKTTHCYSRVQNDNSFQGYKTDVA